MTDAKWKTTTEAAKELGLSRATLTRLLIEEEIPVFQSNHHYRISPEALQPLKGRRTKPIRPK